MGDEFQLARGGGPVSFDGQIIDPGATTGYVLTVNDDGSISALPASGGGLTVWGMFGNAAKHGEGSPVGETSPDAVGELYLSDAPPQLWQSTGTEPTDWTQACTAAAVTNETFAGDNLALPSATTDQFMTWDSPGGAALLDVTVPDQPTVVTVGLYSICVTFANINNTLDGDPPPILADQVICSLLIGEGTVAGSATMNLFASGCALNEAQLTYIGFIPAGTVLSAEQDTTNCSVATHGRLNNAIVTKLA